MTNRQDSTTESVVNVNSIVKVNHTIKCEITLLLKDKQTGFLLGFAPLEINSYSSKKKNVRSHCYRMTNRQDSITESVMNVNSIVICEITNRKAK